MHMGIGVVDVGVLVLTLAHHRLKSTVARGFKPGTYRVLGGKNK